MKQDLWNPEAYAKFKAERDLPFFDLLRDIELPEGSRILDLGCGTGQLTQKLHEQLRASETLGIDNSEKMLSESKAFADKGLSFRLQSIETFEPEAPYNLVFSNAALHFVTSLSQEELLARMTQWLTPQGQLAIHLPANHEHPSQTAACRVAGESPFQEALGGFVRQSPVLRPEKYATLLAGLGYRKRTVRLNVYSHELPNREEVITWVKSSMLTDYQKRMPAELYDAFVNRYREVLFDELPDRTPCIFTFNRILLWASK
ncbi:MAG: methyltransferase domain-containing protein [Planctomycetota bacterium]